MPSTQLNMVVNSLTEEEFHDLEGLRRQSGKVAAYWQLIQWHRGRFPYDPDEEKEVFRHLNLYALRKAARHCLAQGLDTLRSGLPPDLAVYKRLRTHVSEAELQALLPAIQVAKEHATRRGYARRMEALLHLERRVVKRLLTGEDRTTALRDVGRQLGQVHASLHLESQVQVYRATYFDPVRRQYQQTGQLDHGQVAAYLASDFARMDVRQYPLRLQHAKWLMDEWFLLRTGRVREALELAEAMNAAHHQQGGLAAAEHSKLLWRLAIYYSELGERGKAMALLEEFRQVLPESPARIHHYLRKFLIVLLTLAFDLGDEALAEEAEKIVERNARAIYAGAEDQEQLLLLICLSTLHWSRHDMAGATAQWEKIYRIKDRKPRLLYRQQYMVAHLLILHAGDERESLRAFARNYARFLRLHLPATAPALEVVAFLRKTPPGTEPALLGRRLEALVDSLRRWQADPRTGQSFWYAPFFRWAATFPLKKRRQSW